MAEEVKFSSDQIAKLLEFQGVTGIDDMERSRKLLESHNWNLDEATNITLNMREDLPSSDMSEDEELTSDQVVKLLEFQDLAGIDDIERCRNILESHNWDLDVATQVIQNMSESQLQFRDLTRIVDTERCRNVLEFHNWNLDAATNITFNMREDIPSSDMSEDEEIPPDQVVKLLEFQDLVGTDDIDRCRNILESHNWDLDAASQVMQNMRESLLKFRELTGIDDTERCRNILEFHNWNLDEAVDMTLNMREDIPSSDMLEDEELTSDQVVKLLEFQDLAGIDDIERCRTILESHNWDLDVATQVIPNMCEYIPSASDLVAGEEPTPEQIVALSEFRDLTGIDDMERCRYILESYNWDIGLATQVTLNMRDGAPIDRPSTLLDEHYNESLEADQKKERNRREQQTLKTRQEAKDRNCDVEEQKRKEEVQRRKNELLGMVKEEPPLNSPRTICSIIKFSNGTNLERRFSKDDSLKHLYYFISCHHECPDDFQVFTLLFPRRVVPCQPTEEVPEPPTFQEFGVENLETVFVKSSKNNTATFVLKNFCNTF